MEILCQLYLELANMVPTGCISSREKALLARQAITSNPTPAEIELMIEGASNAGVVQRMPDGELRTYFAGFNLSVLAEHLSRELANRSD